jgi:hypothetical protein
MSIADVAVTLAARGKHYEGPGGYRETAATAQRIKEIFRWSPNWHRLSDAQRESLDLISNKLSRILNGNPDHADSWHDLAGYAGLAEKDVIERNDAELDSLI